MKIYESPKCERMEVLTVENLLITSEGTGEIGKGPGTVIEPIDTSVNSFSAKQGINIYQ